MLYSSYGQKKLHSFIEVFTNTFIGYLIAVFTQMIVFPLFEIKVSVSENMLIAVIFTVVSIIRSYVLRRVFNHFTVKNNKNSVTVEQ
ncbi:MAG: hypothetical protein O2942_09100 [Proteobacteria bacterium]|nr:hypothetical protein [Pseudomonadota bacterium]